MLIDVSQIFLLYCSLFHTFLLTVLLFCTVLSLICEILELIPTSGVTFKSTGSSLQLFDETKSWIEALQYCDQQSSSLVEITNQTVLEELKTILANKNELQKEVWVGLERSIFGTNVKWQWTSGAKADQSKWISSFPANGFNNHCGKIVWNKQSRTIQLLDANCHDKLPFICQGELLTVESSLT
uniref:C-type lectin domain-containing protein n=1 Tax=Poecilia mexicana TaxID=48701 RepID=A0A3B3Z132_9TELE